MVTRLGLVFLILFSTAVGRAETDKVKQFTTSCIYGTLAGTLVGAATLAFTSKPGDNLNNVARGASFGLYAGILLGAYVVWSDPGRDEPEGEQGPEGEEIPPEEVPPEEGKLQLMKSVVPLVEVKNPNNWGFMAQVLEFHF